MSIRHESGLLITKRGEHPAKYEGDAMYVVWRDTNEIKTASYLPTLIKYLDMKYKVGQYSKPARVRKGTR